MPGGGTTPLAHGQTEWCTFSYVNGISDRREEGIFLVPMYVLIANWAVFNTPAYYFWNIFFWVYAIGSGYVDTGRGIGPNGHYPPPPPAALATVAALPTRQNFVRKLPQRRDPIGMFWTAVQQAAVNWIGPMGYFWPPIDLTIGVQKEDGPSGRLDFRNPGIAFPQFGGRYITGDYIREFWSDNDDIVENWQQWVGEV